MNFSSPTLVQSLIMPDLTLKSSEMFQPSAEGRWFKGRVTDTIYYVPTRAECAYLGIKGGNPHYLVAIIVQGDCVGQVRYLAPGCAVMEIG